MCGNGLDTGIEGVAGGTLPSEAGVYPERSAMTPCFPCWQNG